MRVPRLLSFRLLPSALFAWALASPSAMPVLAASAPVTLASVTLASLALASITFASAASAAAGDRGEDEDDALPPNLRSLPGLGDLRNLANLARTFEQPDDTAFLDTEPLLTHPLWLHADPGWRAAMLRLPPDAQRLHAQAAGEQAAAALRPPVLLGGLHRVRPVGAAAVTRTAPCRRPRPAARGPGLTPARPAV